MTLGEERGVREIDSQFLVVPCKSVYDCILDMPFAATLYVVAFPFHLKMMFHNIYFEPVTINIDFLNEENLPCSVRNPERKGVQIHVTSSRQAKMANLSKLLASGDP